MHSRRDLFLVLFLMLSSTALESMGAWKVFSLLQALTGRAFGGQPGLEMQAGRAFSGSHAYSTTQMQDWRVSKGNVLVSCGIKRNVFGRSLYNEPESFTWNFVMLCVLLISPELRELAFSRCATTRDWACCRRLHGARAATVSTPSAILPRSRPLVSWSAAMAGSECRRSCRPFIAMTFQQRWQ